MDFDEHFRMKSGGTAVIQFFDGEARVFIGGVPCGRVQWDVQEQEFPRPADIPIITDLSLEKAARRQGIGRRIIEILHEMYPNGPLFRQVDGRRYDDGSHLIDAGPDFARAMVALGIAGWDGVVERFDDPFEDD